MYSKYAELRDSKGFTDYRVSKLTGIAYSTLSEWKKGLYSPKIDKLLALSELFGVPVETFIKKGE